MLVERFKLDSLEIEGLKISKSRHLFSKEELKGANPIQTPTPIMGNEPTSIEELDAEIERQLGVRV